MIYVFVRLVRAICTNTELNYVNLQAPKLVGYVSATLHSLSAGVYSTRDLIDSNVQPMQYNAPLLLMCQMRHDMRKGYTRRRS